MYEINAIDFGFTKKKKKIGKFKGLCYVARHESL